MERKVNQEEFNELVKENMDEFELDESEAIEFAVTQLEAQGVSMANVIADLDVLRGNDAISKFTSTFLDSKDIEGLNVKHFVDSMSAAAELSNRNLKYKMYSGKKGVHRVIINTLKMKPQKDEELVINCLASLHISIKGYPDLVDKADILFFVELFKENNSLRIKTGVLNVLADCVKHHESNKEVVYQMPDTIPMIISCLNMDYDGPKIQACNIITSLCRDDDVRVEISNAHKRATVLAEHILIDTFNSLKFWHSAELTAALLRAVTCMAVNNDLVLKLYEQDKEYEVAASLMNDFPRDVEILCATSKFMVALSGNDDCKSSMGRLIPRIVKVLDENLSSEKLVQRGFLLIASLTLRCRNNALAFIELGAVEKIVQGMKVHRTNQVTKCGCMGLRNIASSSKIPATFEEAGVIDLMNELLKTENTTFITEVKSVLVALGAPVKLDERWSGKQGDIVGKNKDQPDV